MGERPEQRETVPRRGRGDERGAVDGDAWLTGRRVLRDRETALSDTATLDALHHLGVLSVDAWATFLLANRRALERRCDVWWGLPPRLILEMYRVEVVEHLCVAGLARGVAAAAAGHVQLRRVEEAERLAEVRVECRVSTLRLPHPRT